MRPHSFFLSPHPPLVLAYLYLNSLIWPRPRRGTEGRTPGNHRPFIRPFACVLPSNVSVHRVGPRVPSARVCVSSPFLLRSGLSRLVRCRRHRSSGSCRAPSRLFHDHAAHIQTHFSISLSTSRLCLPLRIANRPRTSYLPRTHTNTTRTDHPCYTIIPGETWRSQPPPSVLASPSHVPL